MSSVFRNHSPVVRLAGVLTSPFETFKTIGQTPTWIAPLVIAILFAMVGNAFYYWRIRPDWEQSVRARIEMHRQATGETMTPDQVEQQVAFAKTLGNFFILLPAISSPIFCLVIAGFYFLAFGITFLRAPPFKKILSVVAWSEAAIKAVGVPIVLIVLIAIDKQRAGGLEPASSKLVQSNLSVLLPEGIPSTIKSLASSLDLFTIWFLVLLTIGFADIVGLGSHKLTTWKIVTMVFGLWLAWVLIKAGFVFVFGY